MREETVTVLGRRIREIREQRGMRLSKLADLGDIEADTLHLVEGATTVDISPECAVKIARTLGVSLETISVEVFHLVD